MMDASEMMIVYNILAAWLLYGWLLCDELMRTAFHFAHTYVCHVMYQKKT